MSFKIEMPPVKDAANKEQINKKMFSDDSEKGRGMLAKVLVFTQTNQPVSVTELTDSIIAYYRTEFDRATVFRSCQRLQKLGILNQTVSGIAMTMPEGERKEIHNYILAKHRKFLNKIPAPFKHRYNDVNYFWVANGDGIKYIEWCCRLLGFKCKKEEEKKEDKKEELIDKKLNEELDEKFNEEILE